jgi:hypothetical protein
MFIYRRISDAFRLHRGFAKLKRSVITEGRSALLAGMKGPSKTGSLQTSRLIGEIAAKFALSTAFVNAYFDSQQGFKDKCDQSYETFWSGLDPLQQMYVNFALSTTMRGREIQALVSPQVPLREGRRYLDVRLRGHEWVPSRIRRGGIRDGRDRDRATLAS